VLDLLVEAKRDLCAKYAAKVAEPVFVEIFPRQQDFAIRTFGLPGGSGYLGVCFGRVITMNSPKSQSRLGSNWKSVLWHEFCHVVTLQKTANRMPRWLSEGISVYEERQKNPAWGQVMTPAYREMILGDGLTPVSQLSSAFIQPDSGQALQFAYYQSSMVVEFLVEEYGLKTVKKILEDLRMGMPINQVLGRYTGDVKLLDREFAEYARTQANALATLADWTKPDLPANAPVEAWQQWNAEHPDSIYGLKAQATRLIKEASLDQAKPLVQRLIQLFPEDRSASNGHFLMGMIAKAEGDTKTELEMLKKSSALQASEIGVFERVAELASAARDWPEVMRQADRWLAVNPLVPAPHRVLAEAAEKTGESSVAVQSLKALTLMDPFDPAEAYYRYAIALQGSGQTDLARREVLKCLEQAPRYRQAHQLLIRLENIRETEAPKRAAKSESAAESAKDESSGADPSTGKVSPQKDDK